ncbi:hypothetical protein KEM56_003852 [Ascosphaera pollenicola]|nr:hypothetical protein KEM56_003852 [Ascosphaera pollenicola]
MKSFTRKNAAAGQQSQEDPSQGTPNTGAESTEQPSAEGARQETNGNQSEKDLLNVVNTLKADANIMENNMADMAKQHASQMAFLNAQIKQVQKERDDLLLAKSTVLGKRPAESHPEEPDSSKQHRPETIVIDEEGQEEQPVQVQETNVGAMPHEAGTSGIQIPLTKPHEITNNPLPAFNTVTQEKVNTSLPGMSTLMHGFAPTSATRVPFVAPGVDVAALLAQRSTHHMRKEGDPANKMDGKNKREYKPWLRAVLFKISDNLPSLL